MVVEILDQKVRDGFRGKLTLFDQLFNMFSAKYISLFIDTPFSLGIDLNNQSNVVSLQNVYNFVALRKFSLLILSDD